MPRTYATSRSVLRAISGCAYPRSFSPRISRTNSTAECCRRARFSARLIRSRSSRVPATTIAGISTCPRARNASSRPCPHTRSYRGSPSFGSASATVTGRLRPSLAMLSVIWANFFRPGCGG